MNQIFNAREVFEIAEQIERNGAKFYRKAVEAVQDEDAGKLLSKLAKMEDDHERFFSVLKEKQTDAGDEGFPPDMEDQMKTYLHALAEGKVFGNIDDVESKIKPGDTIRDILETAIEFEKNTIVYFCGVKEIVPEEFGKGKIDILIREEIGHVAMLMGKLRELT